MRYSETCLNQIALRPTFVFEIHGCLINTGFMNKYSNIPYIETSFNVRFIKDSGLLRVRFRQVSPYYVNM